MNVRTKQKGEEVRMKTIDYSKKQVKEAVNKSVKRYSKVSND